MCLRRNHGALQQLRIRTFIQRVPLWRATWRRACARLRRCCLPGRMARAQSTLQRGIRGGHAHLAPPAANSLRQRHIFARAPRRVINTPFPPKTGQKGPPKRPLWELAPCSGRAPPRWPVFPRPPTAGAPVAGWLHGEAQHCVQVSACLLEAVPICGLGPSRRGVAVAGELLVGVSRPPLGDPSGSPA